MSRSSDNCEGDDKSTHLRKVSMEKEAIVQAKSSISNLMKLLLDECRSLDIQMAKTISKIRLNAAKVQEQFYDLNSSYEGSEEYESILEESVCNNSE
jgi:hypothetical protein